MANFHEPDEVTIALQSNWENLMKVRLEESLKCIDKDAYEKVTLKPNSVSKLSIYLVPCDNLPWGPYKVE